MKILIIFAWRPQPNKYTNNCADGTMQQQEPGIKMLAKTNVE